MGLVTVIKTQASPDSTLIVGPYGEGAITIFLLTVGGASLARVVCGFAWRAGTRCTANVRTALRVGAILTSALVLLGIGIFWLLSSLGGSVRYMNVGSVKGVTVTVAEYSTLGGHQLNIGRRDGLRFYPAFGDDAWANDGELASDAPSRTVDGYRLHLAGNDVVVEYGRRVVLRMPIPQ